MNTYNVMGLGPSPGSQTWRFWNHLNADGDGIKMKNDKIDKIDKINVDNFVMH